MIKVMALYRWFEGANFDHEYYNIEHMRIARNALVPFKPLRMESDQVRYPEGPRSGQVVAATSTWFASVAVAEAALAAAGPTLRADLPKYTNIKPEMYISAITAHRIGDVE